MSKASDNPLAKCFEHYWTVGWGDTEGMLKDEAGRYIIWQDCGGPSPIVHVDTVDLAEHICSVHNAIFESSRDEAETKTRLLKLLEVHEMAKHTMLLEGQSLPSNRDAHILCDAILERFTLTDR